MYKVYIKYITYYIDLCIQCNAHSLTSQVLFEVRQAQVPVLEVVGRLQVEAQVGDAAGCQAAIGAKGICMYTYIGVIVSICYT